MKGKIDDAVYDQVVEETAAEAREIDPFNNRLPEITHRNVGAAMNRLEYLAMKVNQFWTAERRRQI